MIIYKKGNNNYLNNRVDQISETFNENIDFQNFLERPPEYHNIKSTFGLTLNGQVIFFGKGRGAGGSQGFESLSFDIYEASQNHEVGIYLLTTFPNSVNKSLTVKMLHAIGVNIYRADRLEDFDVSTSNQIEYVTITPTSIRFNSISMKTDPYKLQPKQSFNIIPLLKKYAEATGKPLLIDSLDGRKNTEQDGPSKRIKDFVIENSLIQVEADVSQTAEKFINSSDSVFEAADVPNFEENKNIASKTGDRLTNNLHDIWVSEEYNRLISKYAGKIRTIVKDVDPQANTFNSDLYVVYDDKGILKVDIYEVKSFPNSQYAKAIGQLLIYRKNISEYFNIPYSLINLFIVIPKNDNLNNSFLSVLNELGINIVFK